MEATNNEQKFIVYCHTNKTNNKKYIGQTCRPLKIRSGKDGKGYKECKYFWNAIQKYGWDNFEHEILFENLSKETADRIEKILIQTLKTQDVMYGYNIQNGGTFGNREPAENLIGKQFTRLKVIGRDFSKNNGVYWLCKCSCGNPELKSISTHTLKSGATLSCGCYNKEQIKKRSTKHGMSSHPLFSVWSKTKELCKNIGSDYYKNNIKFYPEWEFSFINFYNWAINNGYKNGLCLARKNIKLNFCPENCEWITPKELSKKRKNNRIITYNNETKTLLEWVEQLDVNVDTLRYRIDKTNMSLEEIFTKPFKKRHYYTYNNETHSISEWAEIYGIKLKTLRSRLAKGKSIEEALNM